MTVKKLYDLDDTVWIYGISRDQNKPTKGTVVRIFQLDDRGYPEDQDFYVVAIPTEIGLLLEVRTWETISQDERGPTGAFRQAVHTENVDAVDKQMAQIGLTVDGYENIVPQEPTVDAPKKTYKPHKHRYRRKKHKV